MSIESSTIDATAGPPKQARFGSDLVARIERLGEMLNPLLVKEVRQALKSRQFSITFTAVLCLSWLWSIAGVARLGPTVAYGANGPEIFFGYYLILAFPLILIVPYSAYRSLIAEREDNTYELVAITTLRPRQIVAGKLGIAVAQMAVYFSAVAPCLAFTYLLRGIDVPTIFWIMFYTFLASFGFSLCALLLATIAREKHWQVMLAVVIVVVLFYAFLGSMTLCREWMAWRDYRLPAQSVLDTKRNVSVVLRQHFCTAVFGGGRAVDLYGGKSLDTITSCDVSARDFVGGLDCLRNILWNLS